jgi:hypothetical protein
MMNRAISTTKAIILLSVILMSIGCIGTSRPELIGTAIAETLTAIPATPTPQVTPPATPAPKVAFVSFHGRYVTALGEEDGWSLKQEPGLSPCGWFTQYYLDNGKIALVTCHGRYVTAPRRGTTRWDWQLWQESGLCDCGQFKLRQLQNGVALETCAVRFVTAGDGNWPGELAWSLVGETDKIEAWEIFTMLQQ